MIWTKMLELLLAPFMWVVNLLPTWTDPELPDYEAGVGWVRSAYYLTNQWAPMDLLFTLAGITLTAWLAYMTVAGIVYVWRLLPLT